MYIYNPSLYGFYNLLRNYKSEDRQLFRNQDPLFILCDKYSKSSPFKQLTSIKSTLFFLHHLFTSVSFSIWYLPILEFFLVTQNIRLKLSLTLSSIGKDLSEVLKNIILVVLKGFIMYVDLPSFCQTLPDLLVFLLFWT